LRLCTIRILCPTAVPSRLQPSRPSLESLLELYWKLMPEYQAVRLEDLQVGARHNQILG